MRTLLRNPGFSLAAILTLALGIGANTAIFSVADAVLFRPLPYPNASRLVFVWNQLTKLDLDRLSPVSQSAEAYRSLTNIFDSSGGLYDLDRILTGAAGAERVPGMMVTEQVFPMLSPQTVAGRLFTPEEYRSGGDHIVILSSALFLRRFGGDSSILGKSIDIDGRSFRVVGVLSPSFEFNIRAGGIDLWTPKADTPPAWGNSTRMIARLAPGVTLAQAQSALDASARHVDEMYHPYRGPHGEDAGYRVKVISFREQFLGNFRSATIILLLAVTAVLLIACANLANLLLVRALAREKDTIVRRALGASESRLFFEWMKESAVLSLAGGAVGALAAMWGVKLLIRLSPVTLPNVAKISVDVRTLAFTFVISCLVCVMFSLAPALASKRMTWGTRGTTRRSRRAASILIAVEVAFAVMLMIASGLLFKSFVRLQSVNPGFNPEGLLTLQVQFPATRPVNNSRSRAFFSELREKLTGLPGVTSATIGGLPLRGGVLNTRGGDPFALKGRDYGSGGSQFANLNTVGLEYFRTFEIPLRSGRFFAESDGAEAPHVVMVNETLAHRFFPGGAVGQQLGIPKPCRDLSCDFDWSTIIGVAGDVKTVALDQPSLPMIYMPHAQAPFPGAGVILRTSVDPISLTHDVAAVVHSMDPEMPIYDVRTMAERVHQSVGQPRFQTLIVGFFAVAALFLSAIGIFGVVAHSTAQRTQEIGIRMALGADNRRVVTTVVWDGLRPVLIGVALGTAGSLALSHILDTVLFNVPAKDPVTFIASAVILTLVATAACLIPATRATRVDPMIALRAE